MYFVVSAIALAGLSASQSTNLVSEEEGHFLPSQVCTAIGISNCADSLSCMASYTCQGESPESSGCYRDSDCQEGLVCVQTDSLGNTKCLEARSGTHQCFRGRDCAGNATSCVQVHLDGKTQCSTPIATDGECFRSQDCGPTDSCLQVEAAGKRVCKLKGGIDDICFHTDSCAEDLHCDNDDIRNIEGKCVTNEPVEADYQKLYDEIANLIETTETETSVDLRPKFVRGAFHDLMNFNDNQFGPEGCIFDTKVAAFPENLVTPHAD